jgi:hypothetical protein
MALRERERERERDAALEMNHRPIGSAVGIIAVTSNLSIRQTSRCVFADVTQCPLENS